MKNNLELEQLRTELHQKEREMNYEEGFWPVLVYICIKKKKESNRLNEKNRNLKDRIRDLEARN